MENEEKKEKKTGKTFTELEVKELVAKAVAEAMRNNMNAYTPKEEFVTLLYMGVAAEGSTVYLNDKLGEILGRGGTRDIPKRIFLENLTPNVLRRLKDRRLVILSGFSEEESTRYGVNYTEGELLSADIYYKLLDMKPDTVLDIFRKACVRHKAIIASLYIDAYMKNDNRVGQTLIQKLNSISKEVEPNGMFVQILKDMGKQLQED